VATVADLFPGDTVTQGGETAVFIAKAPHPAYATLYLVIWKLADGTWSLDALRGEQEVGDVLAAGGDARWHRVQQAFHGGTLA
jgi:hypothetical protein